MGNVNFFVALNYVLFQYRCCLFRGRLLCFILDILNTRCSDWNLTCKRKRIKIKAFRQKVLAPYYCQVVHIPNRFCIGVCILKCVGLKTIHIPSPLKQRNSSVDLKDIGFCDAKNTFLSYGRKVFKKPFVPSLQFNTWPLLLNYKCNVVNWKIQTFWCQLCLLDRYSKFGRTLWGCKMSFSIVILNCSGCVVVMMKSINLSLSGCAQSSNIDSLV